MANEDLGQQLSFLTQIRDVLKEIPALFEKMGGAVGKQTSALQELAKQGDKATDPEKVKDMNAALEELAGKNKKAVKGMTKQQKAMAAVGAAAAGAKAGFQAFSNILGGTINMASGLASTLFNLATGAFGALMGMWEGLMGIAQSGGGGGGLREEYEKVRAEFGNIATGEGKQVIDTFRELRSSGEFTAKSGLSLRRVFGGLKETMAGVLELAKEFGTSFNRMADDFQNNAAELIILNKGLGLAAEGLVNLTDIARQRGETMNEVLNKTAQVSVHLGKTFGVSSKTIGKNFNELASDVGNFGHLSVEALGATAAYAAKLGVEVKSLSSMFDKFENFEDAAMGAAKLAESFGMNVDAMELMNAESPAEQMDMMRQAFLETGKSLDDLSRQEKKYLAEQMGVDPADLYKMFDPANADISFDDMMAEAEQAQEKVSPEEAMLEVAKNIEKQFQSGMKAFKGFFDAFMQGLEMGIRRTEFFRAVMRSIREALRKVYRIGVKTGQALFGKGGVFGSKQASILPKIREYLGEIIKFFEKLSDNIISLAKGDISLGQFFKNMYQAAVDFFQSDGFQSMGEMLINGISSAITMVMKELPSLLDMLTGAIDDLITGEGNPFSGFDMFGDANSPINQALVKGFEAIKEAWPALKKSLMDLFDKIVEFALDWASENKMLLVKVAGILFGPAVIGGMITLVFATLKAAIIAFGPELMFLIKGVFMKAFTAAGGGMSGAFAGLSAVLLPVIKVIGIIIAVAMVLYEQFQNIMELIDIFGDDTLSLGDKIGALLYTVFLGPFDAVISATANLLDFLTFGFFDFGGKADSLFDNIRSGFMAVFGALTPAFEAIGSVAKMIFGVIYQAISDVFSMFVSIGEVVFTVGEIIFAVLSPVVEIIGVVIYGTLMKIVEGWKLIGSVAMAAFNEYIMPFIQPVIDALSPFIDGIGKIGDSFMDMIVQASRVLNPANWIKMAADAINGFMQEFDLASKISEQAEKAVSAVKGFFGISSPSTVFAGIGGDLTDGLAQGTEGMEDSLKAPSQKSIDKVTKDIEKLDTSKMAEAADQLTGITEMSEAVKVLSSNLNDISIGGGAAKMKEVGKELAGILPAAIGAAEQLQTFVVEYGVEKMIALLTNVKKFTPPLLELVSIVQTMAQGLTDMMEALFQLGEGVKKKSPDALKATLQSTLKSVFGDGKVGLVPELSAYFETLGSTTIEKLNISLGFYAGRVQQIAENAMSISESLKNMNDAWNTVPEVTAAALKVQENITKLVEEIGKVNTALTGLSDPAAEAIVSVKQVADGLKGDGTITVQHESLNIVFQATIQVDSKDLAGALSSGPKGPYFVINTGQAGGAGEGEGAGG